MNSTFRVIPINLASGINQVSNPVVDISLIVYQCVSGVIKIIDKP